ncbi:N-acetyltransferase [Bacteroidia bacterium]|nr:N-acetyltransferase [Bacteroidia bacterium]
MIDLEKECELTILSAKRQIIEFDCGDAELNDFFNNKALHYKNQLLAQTCYFKHNGTGKVVCAFSLSPNALKTADLPGSRRKKVKEHIPREKSMQSYPAFLVGRLGVASEFSGKGIGSQLIRYIKSYCITKYPDFCRFLLIDAYNNPSVLSFYRKNNFSLVFSTEEQECDAYKTDASQPLQTRYLFFDMIHWKDKGC